MYIEAGERYLAGGNAVAARTVVKFLRNHAVTPPPDLELVCLQHEQARSETYFTIYDQMLTSFRGRGFQPDQKLYEFGVGPGVLASRFGDSDLTVVGTDIADNRQAGFRNFALAQDELPFAGGTFDYISVTSVLHHIPSAKHAWYLTELKRILKPDGVLLVQEDERGRSAPEQLAIRVVDRLVSGSEANSHRTKGEWTEFFKNNGLTVQCSHKICHRKGPVRLNKIFFALTPN